MPLAQEGRPLSVSIIIPTWNRLDLLRPCLEAIFENTQDVGYELVVVDNGSTDGTPAYLQSLGNQVRPVLLEQNLGCAPAIHRAIPHATGDFIVLLNNDTLPQPCWLSSMLDLALSDAKIGTIGSKCLYPDLRIQHVGVVFREQGPFHVYWKQGFQDAPFVNQVRDFQAVTGACQLIRRDVWDLTGGYDQEAFPVAYADVDLCLKIREAGYRVVYCPSSVVIHYESSTAGRHDRDDRDYRKFMARWSGKFKVDLEEVVVADGFVKDGFNQWKWGQP